MSSYNEKIKTAMSYIDAVYRIEAMRAEGVTGLYGLEMHRIKKHEELCEMLGINREDTKGICLNLDKSVGFDVAELEQDQEYFLEKYAKKLVWKLGALRAGEVKQDG